jgi:Rhodopirellula transposase DDE domain
MRRDVLRACPAERRTTGKRSHTDPTTGPASLQRLVSPPTRTTPSSESSHASATSNPQCDAHNARSHDGAGRRRRDLIRATTTKSGLRVHAELDENHYPSGVKVFDEELANVPLKLHKFHGEWTIRSLRAHHEIG